MTREEFSKALSFDVSRETWEKFSLYVELLKKWQRKINLISPNTVNNIWIRHVLDSAQLQHFIPHNDKKIVDIGSGAGFPALVLSMMGYNNIVMIESDHRKCSFLRAVLRQCDLSSKVICSRIEDVNIQDVDIVTARALSSLDKLLEYSFPLLSSDGFCLFLKGEKASEEIIEARENWVFSAKAFESVTSKNAQILQIAKIKPK